MQSNVLIALIIYTSLHCILLRNNILSLNKSRAGYLPNYTLCQCMNAVMRYAKMIRRAESSMTTIRSFMQQQSEWFLFEGIYNNSFKAIETFNHWVWHGYISIQTWVSARL